MSINSTFSCNSALALKAEPSSPSSLGSRLLQIITRLWNWFVATFCFTSAENDSAGSVRGGGSCQRNWNVCPCRTFWLSNINIQNGLDRIRDMYQEKVSYKMFFDGEPCEGEDYALFPVETTDYRQEKTLQARLDDIKKRHPGMGRLIMPFLSGNHWVMIQIVYNGEEKGIKYYNSKPGCGYESEIEKALNSHAEKWGLGPLKKPIKTSIQRDSFQCGPWVLFCAEHCVNNGNDQDFEKYTAEEAQKISANARARFLPFFQHLEEVCLCGGDSVVPVCKQLGQGVLVALTPS